MRYVIFNADKHQDDVTFADDWEAYREDADDHCTVIVDTWNRRRYFGGRWEPCRIVPPPPAPEAA